MSASPLETLNLPGEPIDATTDGLCVEHRGAGPRTLVLLHGWAMNLRVFDALAESLAPDFRVLAIDLPGHGRSAEPAELRREGWTLERLAAAIAPRLPADALLLGWSLGGQVALQLALDAPARVAALALVSTTPRFVAGDDWPHGIAASVLAHFARHLGGEYRETVRDFLDLQVRGSREAPAALATLQAALFSHGEAAPVVLARALEVLRHADLRDRLGQVATPALVLAGQYDRVTPPGAARALAAALPRGRHHEFARCGHAPFLSHAAEFTAALRGFAAEVFTADRIHDDARVAP
jgi:pimeloyl-[acyl-carrier protein] methyl ester esterase